MTTRLLAGMVVAVVCACSGPTEGTRFAPAGLDRAAAEVVVASAVTAMAQALADLDATGLPGHFAGPALHQLTGRVGWMRARGMRMQEQGSRHALLSWDLEAGEAVLEVEAQVRMLSADQPDPPWSATTRQWWSRLASIAGAWLVVDDRDLPPDQWRR